jgi:C1A family cysteine protease
MNTKKLNEFKRKFGMGWKPDLPDARDYYYATSPKALTTLPVKVDLRNQCPPVFNQGNLGSCTANGGGSMWQFIAVKTKRESFTPSRLFLYYNTRLIEGTQDYDSGAYLRDTLKTLVGDGICDESIWSYEDNTPKFTQRPADLCYTEGEKHQTLSYQRVMQNILQIKGSLAEGYPFVFGFAVYESFFLITRNGKMPMPNFNTETIVGGHAVMAVGYDDEKQVVIVRNSWGDDWGDGGYFYMPYSYLTNNNLCDDFWTIRLVE